VGWWILGGIVAFGVLIWGANRLGWIDLSDKSRASSGGGSRGGGALMIGDEVFAPAKYEAQVELDRQARLPVPAPIPGDGDKGIFGDGPVRIHLDASGKPQRTVTSARADASSRVDASHNAEPSLSMDPARFEVK